MLFSILPLLIAYAAGPSVTAVRAPADQPPPCAAAEMAYHDTLKMVLLFNCAGQSEEAHGRVWGWNGARWVVVSADAPSPRALGGAVYDSRRGVVVMYGGVQVHGATVTWFPETWEWDGKVWRKIGAAPPGVTDRFAMAFDEARGVAVLFGGQGPDGVGKGDTWTWDGKTWLKRTGDVPGVEEHQAMTYDSKRRRVVLLGGHQPEDLWEWDGSTWTRVGGDQPRARSHAALAYDEKADQLILYGGLGGRVWLGSTSVRQGEIWSLYRGEGPSARGLCALAYDRERGTVILYGGDQTPLASNGPEVTASDTWEWDGRQWTRHGLLVSDDREGIG